MLVPARMKPEVASFSGLYNYSFTTTLQHLICQFCKNADIININILAIYKIHKKLRKRIKV